MKKGAELYGSLLEQYEITEHIANGGNSEVYKVKNSKGEIYALKLLNTGISKEKLRRFKNEMAFCIRTENPNIIKIVDNGITDDKEQIFYIMPYYNKTLRTYINEEHTAQDKIQLFIRLLKGVSFFHKKEIIHRDIKPENILLSNDNFPIISDFGIAHFTSEEMITQIETKIGSKMANFQYAAPEQREKNGIITNKTDIYALGLIFNEMFTRKIPFGNSYKKVKDINKQFAFLDKIIDKMISQSPDNRQNSVDDVIYEIKAELEINKREKEIKELQEITYSYDTEEDILILEPPKLIDFKYDDIIEKLFLYLDKKVNQEWINCMTEKSCISLFGYEPKKFRFENNVASVKLPFSNLERLQLIIDYFKEWINHANQEYPAYVKKKREQEQLRQEQIIMKKIEREEKIKKELEKAHI
ncbi:MAG TPA: serine/threonine protein kinase [Candidatus Coprosoma intestinipullorum]|uniref:Serine/threonine protein kinase n=1 Tax=Candidatus Coprosoma intestinipullorum TaxID=2840752 RepID=A0A9D0ZQ75_9FIRM|nr:serine/threonine protein kinase [Candidatus Coprosoma intestinipullorum]